jgi:hypothetical protein
MKELEKYQANKLDNTTVHIEGAEFNFFYTIADYVVKDEFKGKYEYVGGLQCNYPKESENYVLLEIRLRAIAKALLL